MNSTNYSGLLNNRILKERSRLLIVSFLMAAETNNATFMTIQKSLNLSRGNLSIQLKTLDEAKYITITKLFKNNKPQTTIHLTNTGITSLKKYLNEMETVIESIKL